ncbi:hypothetical protein HPP92_013973 [Vanilla planifolia]|uniref:Uncharacterized protein n=1 Tax=Vanilla planifolia TaxID=51239 RepID=A0A835QSY7_VANPL|nr:hypothetical protein HPP92_013973 [Vanilla planifolia]
MDLSQPRFTRHRDSTYHMTPNLYVANCGPAVGISVEAIKSFFSSFGEVAGVHAADKSGSRIIVCFLEVSAAEAAYRTLNGCRCEALGGRILHVQYSEQQQPLKVDSNDSLPVSLFSSELAIPGIYLLHDFISSEEEQELLSAVDSRPWKNLSKRRVQHYGYEFLYETRNVDSKNFIGELPSFVIPVLEKLVKFHGEGDNNSKLVDQLTVNEYPPGIGLSPHIDTHSAFDNMIFSLSLSGTCIMEFRKYLPWHSSTAAVDVKSLQECSSSLRKSIFLPARSMLLLSGEGRYAWHHYIPHHKVDIVRGDGIRRSSRRVSFTFRKVRRGPCQCEFPQHCDSRMEI